MKRNAFLALIILSLLILPLSAQCRRNQSRRLAIDEVAQQQAANYWTSVLKDIDDLVGAVQPSAQAFAANT